MSAHSNAQLILGAIIDDQWHDAFEVAQGIRRPLGGVRQALQVLAAAGIVERREHGPHGQLQFRRVRPYVEGADEAIVLEPSWVDKVTEAVAAATEAFVGLAAALGRLTDAIDRQNALSGQEHPFTDPVWGDAVPMTIGTSQALEELNQRCAAEGRDATAAEVREALNLP